MQFNITNMIVNLEDRVCPEETCERLRRPQIEMSSTYEPKADGLMLSRWCMGQPPIEYSSCTLQCQPSKRSPSEIQPRHHSSPVFSSGKEGGKRGLGSNAMHGRDMGNGARVRHDVVECSHFYSIAVCIATSSLRGWECGGYWMSEEGGRGSITV